MCPLFWYWGYYWADFHQYSNVSGKEQQEQFKRQHPRGKKRKRQQAPWAVQVERWNPGWEPENELRMVATRGGGGLGRKWKSWTFDVVMRKHWEKDTWNVRRSMPGWGSHCHRVSYCIETRKPGCWQGMEMPIPENCCCNTHPTRNTLVLWRGVCPKVPTAHSSFQ